MCLKLLRVKNIRRFWFTWPKWKNKSSQWPLRFFHYEDRPGKYHIFKDEQLKILGFFWVFDNLFQHNVFEVSHNLKFKVWISLAGFLKRFIKTIQYLEQKPLDICRICFWKELLAFFHPACSYKWNQIKDANCRIAGIPTFP